MKCKMCENERTSLKYIELCTECENKIEISHDKYNEFMEEYDRLHKACPKCGGLSGTSTLMGYVLNMDMKENYKNLNRYNCLGCGDRHVIHDRVPYINT